MTWFRSLPARCTRAISSLSLMSLSILASLSAFTTDLTGITDEHVRNAKPLEQVLKEFQEFCKDSILVAHNATFDVGFMNVNYERHCLPKITQPVIDTLEFARNFIQSTSVMVWGLWPSVSRLLWSTTTWPTMTRKRRAVSFYLYQGCRLKSMVWPISRIWIRILSMRILTRRLGSSMRPFM